MLCLSITVLQFLFTHSLALPKNAPPESLVVIYPISCSAFFSGPMVSITSYSGRGADIVMQQVKSRTLGTDGFGVNQWDEKAGLRGMH
jgi:hypothetical protein